MSHKTYWRRGNDPGVKGSPWPATMWKCLTADRYDLIVCGTSPSDARWDTNRHSPREGVAGGLRLCKNVETAFDLTGTL
jgi:hypothetical protein